jgi:hypothetical protein
MSDNSRTKKPAYADVVRRDDVLPVNSTGDDDEWYDEYDQVYEKSYVTVKPAYITRRDSSYDTWERYYLKELLELRNIFVKQISQVNPEMILYLSSPEFFLKFNRFIYKNSTTKISQWLEPLTEELETIYSEYKDKIYNINELQTRV